jgi:hypothetical protein
VSGSFVRNATGSLWSRLSKAGTGDKIAGGTGSAQIAESGRVACRLLTRAFQKGGSSPRVSLLMVMGAGGLLAGGLYPAAGYIYDSTWTPGSSAASWQANGGASFGSSSVTFGSGGAIIVSDWEG